MREAPAGPRRGQNPDSIHASEGGTQRPRLFQIADRNLDALSPEFFSLFGIAHQRPETMPGTVELGDDAR